jgi:hypothetical protein
MPILLRNLHTKESDGFWGEKYLQFVVQSGNDASGWLREEKDSPSRW